MPKSKEACFVVTVDLLGADIAVIIGNADYYGRQATRLFGKKNVDTTEDRLGMAGTTPDGLGLFIWLGLPPSPVRGLALAAHETSHMVDTLLDNYNIPPGEESTEVRALLTEYIFGNILAKWKAHK